MKNSMLINSTAPLEEIKPASLAPKLIELRVNVYPGYYDFVHFFPPLNTLPKVSDASDILAALQKEEQKIGLYIHIPFCYTACKFCYYPKRIKPSADETERYIKSLSIEASRASNDIEAKIHSVYIGGGSPSYLDTKDIIELGRIVYKNFDITSLKEFTFEVEPHTFDKEKLSAIIDIGVDRISMGIQSLDDRILKFHRRAHTAEEAIEKVTLLKQSNVRTFNLDFMYGLQGQPIDDLVNSLEFICDAQPPSVTFYQVWFQSQSERSTNDWKNRALPLKTIAQMKDLIYSTMKKEDYSVNNQCWFIKAPSDACIHFTWRWQNNPYIGLGQAAYSYFYGTAYQNAKTHLKYYDLINKQTLPIECLKILTHSEMATRATILGLKTDRGINIIEIQQKYRVSLKPKAASLINELCKMRILIASKNTLFFSEAGTFWGDCVLSKLMSEILYE